MNVSAVALAAVDIAATALDSALLSVERTVERSQQRPEVSKHIFSGVCASKYPNNNNLDCCKLLSVQPTLVLCQPDTPGCQDNYGPVQYSCVYSGLHVLTELRTTALMQLPADLYLASLCFALVCKFVLDGHL